MKIMENQHVWTKSEFATLRSISELKIGDLVEQAIVDDFMDCLPPACMTSRCAQLGEPYSMRMDEAGTCRKTYLTFTRVSNNVFRYCGDCFIGEIERRGVSIPRI